MSASPLQGSQREKEGRWSLGAAERKPRGQQRLLGTWPVDEGEGGNPVNCWTTCGGRGGEREMQLSEGLATVWWGLGCWH